MNLVARLPKPLKTWLLMQGIDYAFDELEVKHLGTLLREAMNRKIASPAAPPAKKRLAKWLRQVADEVEA